MRSIQIGTDEIGKTLEGYAIRLGNGTQHEFKNNKAAIKFVVQTNKFLTQKYFDLNLLYAELQGKVLEVWLYLLDSRFEKLQRLSSDAGYILHMAHYHSRRFEGNHWAFIDLRKIANYIQEIAILLKEADKGKTNTFNLYNLNSIIERANLILADLNSYGRLKAVAMFDIQNIEEEITPKNQIQLTFQYGKAE